jgi:hypothetical protein
MQQVGSVGEQAPLFVCPKDTTEPITGSDPRRVTIQKVEMGRVLRFVLPR